ncbi:hypothetical protein G5S42_07210 [Paraburkholderia sp. JPY169]|uniref:Uncharacterized protein n=1 Tax=Paraburkholderia youngii TaxID=2782701 RepID=A0A7Y6JWB4_9BURK|nr:hypothetical protein [Paraburkholderia youngii]
MANRLSEGSGTKMLLLEAAPKSDRFWVHTPASVAKLLRQRAQLELFTEPMPALDGRKMY